MYCFVPPLAPKEQPVINNVNSNIFNTKAALVLLAVVAGCGSSAASSGDGGPQGGSTGAGGAGTGSGGTAGHPVVGAAGTPVNLATAGNYVILAESGISTVPPSVVKGNLGISPAAATY